MKRVALLILLLLPWLAPGRAGAQIFNVQSVLRFMWLKGNADYSFIEGAGGFKASFSRHTVIFLASLRHGTLATEGFLNESLQHLRYSFELFPFLAPEIFTQHQNNLPSRLSMRLLGGAGPRFSLVRSKKVRLLAGTSYMVEKVRYTRSTSFADSGKELLYHRWSTYLMLKLQLAPTL